MGKGDDFKFCLAHALQENQGKRVFVFVFEGKRFWVKQEEGRTFWERFYRPNGRKALKNEARALRRAFAAAEVGLCPRLVAEGEGFLVIEDMGSGLHVCLEGLQGEARLPFLELAAKALARLHGLGLSHGRPALRDMVVRDGAVAFVDFEAGSWWGSLLYRQARDVFLFVQNLYRTLRLTDEEVWAVLSVYKEALGEKAWPAIARRLRFFSYFLFLLRPLGLVFKGSDADAVFGALRLFRRL